ncbi:MAG: GreA/GreB family elongation factor [Kiritimatiellaeota bacterium]|nr:GreA/GreB family elongation factor [Kiritimatiellota bacterium]
MPEAHNNAAPGETIEAQEEWLLANVQDPAIPIQSFGVVLNQLHAAGHTDRAESGADLLFEALAARRDEAALLALLGLQAAWHTEDPPFAATCAKHLIMFFQKDPATLALIPHAGFNKNLPATECLKRFCRLRRLRPEALCYEKTWGFGTVAELDAYAHQVVINFEKKKAHRMALAYAAETLDLLDADHLLARRHRDSQAFTDWLAKDPASVVICALRSFGPMSAAQLQELMIGLVMSAEAWKKFWDAARKQLKQNPLVEFPAKRTDPLRLLEKARSYDAAWLKTLRAERDFNHILKLVEDMQTALTADERNDELRETVEDRLAFVMLGASKLHWGQAAQAGMLGRELGITWHRLNINDYAEQFLQDAVFLDTLRDLPARRLRSFFAFVHEIGAERALALFFRVLPETASSALTEMIEYLQAAGQMPQVLETMRALIGANRASCEMVYWLCRHVDVAQTNGIGTAGNLAMEALAVLEARDATGERLKAKHQLRALFEQPPWLKTALDSMNAGQRHDFMRRLKNSTAWAAIDRGAILARILKLYPELSAALQDEAAVAPAPTARLTSLRSYRERQALLTKIVNQDIPKNSQDIAVARSFGDLRENFEYKAAKETQGILLRRKSDLESQLASVKSTDFEQFPATVAGPGTCVTLRQADGKTKTYYILGEWDSDETRGILSARCKFGEAVTGHRPGDTVTIPSETGNADCTLVEVGGLPPDIKAWILGNA